MHDLLARRQKIGLPFRFELQTLRKLYFNRGSGIRYSFEQTTSEKYARQPIRLGKRLLWIVTIIRNTRPLRVAAGTAQFAKGTLNSLGFHLGLDVDATERAKLCSRQPLVDARDVEEMHARQSAHIFALFVFTKANRALLRVVLARLRLCSRASHRLLVRVRQRVPLDAALRRTTRQLSQPPLLVQSNEIVQTLRRAARERPTME